jgi:DhnA family fructose-bisphosphate aldolase class Ia
VFAGLGTWVDVFDIDDDPAKLVGAVRDMAARGVRTLYLESSRFDRPSDVENPHTVAAALREAHSLGMRVVAWYPPSFTDVDHDVRRTVAAVQYVSPAGDRFDGVAADIERTDVRDTADRNARLIDYSRRVRDQTGGMPLAAIVIPPTSLAYNPARWPEFPWANIAPSYDVFMPMNYWTYRKRDAETARTLTEQNMAETTRLTRRPVHIIGGEAAQADLAQVAAYVGAALQSGSIGGGLYDWFTTRAEVWDELRKLIG